MKTEISTEGKKEINRRRTFAIISHPDAGKTTITEKLLLFGNAIQMAGQVRAKKNKQFTTSDWMEIERQRGISVTSSVMQFEYRGHEFNLLDTPGHADFSEDTYRVLTAVDSALMVIDSSKGLETQTLKLFQVCRDRKIPIITLMNKMDLEGKDPFDLVDEVEKVLKIRCSIMTWPLGQGKRFKGVFDLAKKNVKVFQASQKKSDMVPEIIDDITSDRLKVHAGEEVMEKFVEDHELLAAGTVFDKAEFLKGDMTPVYFGSGINNFGVQELLDSFIDNAPSPGPRPAETRSVSPYEADFSGVIFKIQANMDPKHRDRFAFMRVCSGEFVQGMDVYHVRGDREFKIHNATQFMAQERKNVDRAYAGDIIGIHDRGNLMIGDTLTQGEKIRFLGIPQFSPDLFCRVELKNPIKIKQLQKGLEQLAEEGTSQLFRRKTTSDNIIGVVGKLQFEVVKFRLQHEYGAEAIFTPMNYNCSRWYYAPEPADMEALEDYYREQVVFDVRNYTMMLFKSEWEKDYVAEKFPKVKFFSSLINYELEVK